MESDSIPTEFIHDCYRNIELRKIIIISSRSLKLTVQTVLDTNLKKKTFIH